MVVATKGFFQMREDDPNSGGLSRKAIEQELDASLDRLGMDTVDLYQTHRWDYDTPIERTMRALDDTVRRGKARHVGASSMWAHQFADALATSDRENLERYATIQNHYSLLYREEEREMLPMTQREKSASSRGRRWPGASSRAPTRRTGRPPAARARPRPTVTRISRTAAAK